MPPAPVHPRHLVGSAWTRLDDAWTYCHWEIVSLDRAVVTLRATLDRTCVRGMAWRELRDRTTWLPGWRSRVSVDDRATAPGGAGPDPGASAPTEPGRRTS